MRIAIVTQSYHPVFGGVTEHVQGLALSLLRRGHEVAVITGGVDGASVSSEERCLRRAGGDVIRVGRPYRVRCNGASVTIVGEPGLASRLRALPRNRFDVVHVHSPLEPFLPMAAAFWFDAPIVGTFHSAGRRGRGYRIFRPLLLPIMQRLRIRTVVSASARDYVEKVFPGSYRSIPNGVDLDRFRRGAQPYRAGKTMDRSHARVLMVGRLDPRKGHEIALAAVERYSDAAEQLGLRSIEPPCVRLDIVGDGPLRRRLVDRAKRLPVRFHGSLSGAETADLYRRADLVLAPAQYGESFGVVLLEAMAAGCPVIASDIPGYRDVLAGSGAGLLVARDDPYAWAHAMRELLVQPWKMRAMAESGEAYVARFSWDLLAGEMEKVYEEAGAERIPARVAEEGRVAAQLVPTSRAH